MSARILHRYKGELLSQTELARAVGLTPAGLSTRKTRGKISLTEPTRKRLPIRIKCQGKWYPSYGELARALGVKPAIISTRVRNGIPPEGVNRKRGTGHLDKDGYKRIGVGGRVLLEHRVVMSAHLKRPLLRNETVHHVNGNRLDNRLENLELWTSWHPPGQRVKDQLAWCYAFIKRYGK